MIDLYLRAPDQAAMDAALAAAGLIVDGEAMAAVCLDRIGPFDRVIGHNQDGSPILQHYADYHANVRLRADIGDRTALADTLLVMPQTPFRVWLD